MRTRLLFVALILLICGSVVAAEKPAIDIPIYPGGESTMEINLTQEDLLPTLKAVLPMMNIPGMDKVDMNDLDAALKDVTRFELLQVDVRKNVTEAQISDFYAKKASAGTWNRVFWQRRGMDGSIALYVQGMGEKLYGFYIKSIVEDEKPVKRVQLIKTEGKIDYVKLLQIAAKMYM